MLADPNTVAPNFSVTAPAVEPVTPENGYFGRVTPLTDEPPAPLFQPVATAPAKTADEALVRLADDITALAKRERAAHESRADLQSSDPRFEALGAEAGKLFDTMFGHLDMARLVRADTVAGLAAKGRAVLALREIMANDEVPEAPAFLLSMAEDAVRLAAPATVAEVDAATIALAKRVLRLTRMEQRAFTKLADLERAIEDQAGCRPRDTEARDAAEAARRAEMAKIGNVLDYRMNDPVFIEACEKASAAAARARAPFDATLAAWEAEKARLCRETGVEAAAQRQSRLTDRLEAVGLQLAAMKPRTLTGCVAMAEAAEAVSAIGISGGWEDTLHEAVTRALAHLWTATPAKPLVFRAIVPDRRAMESYRTWLEREYRALTHEMYPGRPQALGEVYLNNPGGRFHFRGEPPASSRAERILAAVGVDWRHDPVAETDRRHEQAA